MTTQYLTPVPQDQYQSVGLITAILGFFLLAYFFIYQGAYKTRSLVIEVSIAVLAAASIAMGIFFLGLSVGIYM